MKNFKNILMCIPLSVIILIMIVINISTIMELILLIICVFIMMGSAILFAYGLAEMV